LLIISLSSPADFAGIILSDNAYILNDDKI
jgi:hypothetical protein